MKHAAPVMKAQGSGGIITTASVGHQLRTACLQRYPSAVIGLTRSVALELGPFSIRVNAICWQYRNAHLRRRASRSRQQRGLPGRTPGARKGQPIPRAGEPEDIAHAALFLASDESSFITGQALWSTVA